MANFGPIMKRYTGSGSEDPKAWINTYLTSLDAAGIPPSSRHVYFCRNLDDGLALKWYIEEVPLVDKPYWDKLHAAFKSKWIPPPTDSMTHSALGAPVTPTPSDDTATEKLHSLAISSPTSPLGKLSLWTPQWVNFNSCFLNLLV